MKPPSRAKRILLLALEKTKARAKNKTGDENLQMTEQSVDLNSDESQAQNEFHEEHTYCSTRKSDERSQSEEEYDDIDGDPDFVPDLPVREMEDDPLPDSYIEILPGRQEITPQPSTSYATHTITEQGSTPAVDLVAPHLRSSDSSDSEDNNVNLQPVQLADEPARCRKRKGRKQKHEGFSREDMKKQRNSNLRYFTYKDKEVESKIFANFQCNCPLKCADNVDVDIRKEYFRKFWALGSYEAQNGLLCSLISERSVARKRRRSQNRQYSRTYTFNDKQVCRDMFVQTFQISTKRVNTALVKLRNLDLLDRRGLIQGGANKISVERSSAVIDHINRIPRYKSHYRRNTGDQEYLSPELTIQKMYNLYREEQQNPVSFSTYRSIFYKNFNLKFKPLKKDCCNVCDSLAAKLKCETIDEDVKKSLEEEQQSHFNLWKDARSRMKEDMQSAKENEEIECLCFDLEKTLPLPRIPTNIVFYKRQLWLYNSGIHSGKSNKGYCYVWVENEAGRGAQEVGSCLIKHIEEHMVEGVQHLILWADSCGGQNRNIKLTLMMKATLQSHPSLQTITLRFLISGHSFLPNDSDFSDIECALKHQQRMYLPIDYINVMKDCRRKNKFVVTKMTADDFLGTAELERHFVNRKIDESNEKVNWLKVREIHLKKDEPYKLYMKTSFQEEPKVVDIKRKTRGRQTEKFTDFLVKLWPNGKEVAEKKLADLKSMMYLIPSDAHAFYRSLHGNRNLTDDVDGFTTEPDFEIQFE